MSESVSGLLMSSPGFTLTSPGLSESLGLPESSPALLGPGLGLQMLTYRQTDGWMDGRTDGQIPPVFYRTSSLFGAEAQKEEQEEQNGGKKNKEINSLGFILMFLSCIP